MSGQASRVADIKVKMREQKGMVVRSCDETWEEYLVRGHSEAELRIDEAGALSFPS